MARRRMDEMGESDPVGASPVSHGPSVTGAAEAAAGADPAAGASAQEPVIVIYESSERDSKTRLQIVQSGFGSTAAWTALVDAWHDTSASFALLPSRLLTALCSAARVLAPAPAFRPAAVRP